MKSFCLHDWPKWGLPVDTHTGFEKRQFRFCKKCNAMAYRTVRFNAGINAANIVSSVQIKEQSNDT